MSRAPSALHLVVPGLLAVPPGAEEAGSLPEAPWLETLLARAEVRPSDASGLEATLFDLFGVAQAAGCDLPSAACARLADGGVPDDAWWLHADPVFFKPDGDRLLVFDASVLDIQPEEAAELAALCNAHFASEGWQLETLAFDRWYLRLPVTPAVTTHPLSEVLGRNIDHFLPGGTDGRLWHGLLNEVQMLFHGAAVNARREAVGRLPINGIWFHGGGRLPDLPGGSIQGVIADHPLARGLALRAGIPALSLPPVPALAEGLEGDWVLVSTQVSASACYADADAWPRGLAEIEAWVRVLCGALRTGRLRALVLHPGDGRRYRLDARGLRRFWRRRRPLNVYRA